MVRPEITIPPHTLFYEEDSKYTRGLRTIGEMAVIAIHEGKKVRSKLDDRGKTCMIFGYADDHKRQIQVLEHSQKEDNLKQGCEMANIIWKQYKKRSIFARKQVELFLDEEERSLEDE